MFDTVFGLPVHALVVHATVVVVPLAAVSVLLAACWPRFRRWAGPLPLGLSLIALVLDPITTSSGEALERRVGHSPLVEQHAHLADGLLPWVIGLTVAAGALAWVWYRQHYQHDRPQLALSVLTAVAALAVVTSLGTTVQVVRIGHSGAKAAWSDVVQNSRAAGG